MSEGYSIYYTVVPSSYDGGDILSFHKLGLTESKWPDYTEYELSPDADRVHLHATLAAAIEYGDEYEYGGSIIGAMLPDDLIQINDEGYPCIMHRIRAAWIVSVTAVE